MKKWRSIGVKLDFLVNPFYFYPLSFAVAIFFYLWGWSDLYPRLSAGLIIFFLASFAIFIFFGYKLDKKQKSKTVPVFNPELNDILFISIVFLGIINIILVGYIPIFDKAKDYREFGFPVIDPVFNSLSIFFSVFFLQSFLEIKKRRFLAYFFIILILQIFLFRRSTIVWILASACFLMILYFRKVNLGLILLTVVCIPIFSYGFGLYGDYRSSLSKQYIVEDLKASDRFIKTGLSHHHYITYLYLSSPLANLQKNIDEGAGFSNNRDIKDFLFYSIVPVSVTLRLEKRLNLSPPECPLITPDLIAGSFLMTSFFTFGWTGMIILLIYFLAILLLCLFLVEKWSTFQTTTICILSTTVALLIFGNFINRLDVLLMILFYPFFFHFIFSRSRIGIVHTKVDQ